MTGQSAARSARRRRTWAGCLVAAALAGCTSAPERLQARHRDLQTVGVAPFFNRSTALWLSGREVAVAFYTELQQVGGLTVVPVGVVETAMRRHRIELTDAQQAVELARVLELDALVVGAITHFDPYRPPQLGLSVRVYGRGPRAPAAEASLERLSRSPAAASRPAALDGPSPRIAVDRLFDAGRPDVVAAIQHYAQVRAGDQRVDGWQSYLDRSDDFIRFCCYQIVRTHLARPMPGRLARAAAREGILDG